MKILLVSATKPEIASLLKKFRKVSVKGNISSYRFGKQYVDVLITGVGMTATAFYLGKTLNNKYGLVINAGIAGSFKKNIPPGSVVNAVSDCFADFGAEDGNKFLTAEEIGLGGSSIRSQGFSKKIISKELSKIQKVNAITVNTVHGNNASIRKVVKRFDPDIESMEGAAFFLSCNYEKISCLQIRAISNYVEKRNKKGWKIDLGIQNLGTAIEKILSEV